MVIQIVQQKQLCDAEINDKPHQKDKINHIYYRKYIKRGNNYISSFYGFNYN